MAATSDVESLRRLGGGRWQTRDGRFTIEAGDGRWSVVDAEQVDELGLPRVRGPYGSLTAAKAAIAGTRDAPAEASPLAERAERSAAERRRAPGRDEEPAPTRSAKAKPKPPRAEEEPPLPGWIARLGEDWQERAVQLVRDLERAGFDDAERIAREEIVEDRPAAARALLLRRIAKAVRAAGDDAEPADVAARVLEEVAHGSDPDVPARLPGWVLAERREAGENRPLSIRRADVRRAVGEGASDDRRG